MPIAVADNPPATLEDTPSTFNVTDNDLEVLAQIDPSTVDLNLVALGIQNTFTNSDGEWAVDSDGNVTYTPALNFSGTASASYTVRNNLIIPVTSLPAAITISVTAVNDEPSITAIAPQTIPENSSTAAIDFTVDDVETAASGLDVSGSSDNIALVPNANIVFGGSGAGRTVTVTPLSGQSGNATITVAVDDGTDVTSTDFLLTVNANTPPTITPIGAQSTNEDIPTDPITFTIGDAETPLSGLTLSGTSSNTTLVPDANIVFGGGNGANRNVVITPEPGLSGTTTITITVSDGTLSTPTNFLLTVNAVNSLPTITAIGPQTTPESTPTSAIPFTVGDEETPAGSLTLTGTSSNTALVPNANIVFGGSNASRTVTITPLAGQNGTTTITVVVNDGTGVASTNFVLTVTAVNDPPTISAIGNQTATEDTPTSAIGFTVGDAETLPGDLTVTGSSGNTTLVPNANIVFGGSGANRTVTITPALNQSGTTTITINVSDGSLTTPESFTLTVNADNDPPTISAINDHSTPENTPTGAIAFTVADADNAASTLTVSGTSSNVALIPNANIVFGGSGANRTVTLTPLNGQSGTATITITVSDGTATGSTTFQLNVNDVNNPPTISDIADQTTSENTATAAIPFTVGDAETAPASLTLTASSSNPSLVPVANITFGGSGAARTVTINPGASQSGSATITITVSDGSSSTSKTFNLIINPVNDAPTVTPIANQTTAENTPTAAIPFSVGDAETPASNLIVTGTSSVPTLVPNGNIVIDGSGSDRTVTLTPAAGQSGSTLITISVGDGAVTTTISFTLTVSSVNDPPTITAITDQTTTEDVATPALPFTVGDGETPAADLTVTASSSDQTLVPNGNIVVFGNDISRTVTITPALNQTGTTTITLTVNDGTATASISFQLTVTTVDDAPTITSITDQTTTESTATGAIAFKVGDADTPPGSLVVTGTSSNLVLVPNANIVLEGSGEDRTVTITPVAGQSGVATITLTVSDGESSAATSFQLTVTSINDAPTITAIPAQSTSEDTQTGLIAFTVNDAETPATSLTVTGSSSNKELVPDANIAISITGAARSMRLTPAANQYGTTTITLTVTDGSATAQTTFTLTVTPVNDPPVITAQEPLVTPEDTPITLVPENFTIVDPDNTQNDYGLIIVASSNYAVMGTTITPLPDFDGELSVTVKATDGKLFSPDFVAKITVTDVNIAPVITGQNPPIIIIEVNKSAKLDQSNIIFTDPDSKPEEISFIVSEGSNYTVSGTDVIPLANYTGPLEVVVRANDGKATGPPFTVKINVVLPSAQPLITGQIPLIIQEDTPLSLEFDHLTVTDADDLDYPNGFTLNILPGEDYSASNNQITPSLNYNGFLEAQVTVNDGEKTSEAFTLRIYVVPVNDAPEITVLESDPVSYEPGTGPIAITEQFECDDVDNDFLTLADIRLIDPRFSPNNDELVFENRDDFPIRGVYDASTGVLSLLGYATIEDYITAIRSVKYNYRLTVDINGEQTPISTEPKKIQFSLSDGQLGSEIKERSIELKTSVELSIPNTFTPNGDSENNTWAVQPITNTDQFNDTVVRVYNKRGLLVYESIGLEKEWDGTYNGELLPVDTYYYTIDLKLSFIKKTYKGAVMILR